MSECQTKAGNLEFFSPLFLEQVTKEIGPAPQPRPQPWPGARYNHEQLNKFCFHVYAQNLLSHFLTLTLSHSHSFSLSHSFNLSFNHSRHAEQVLFSSLCSKVTVYCRKLQCFFFDILLITLTCYFRCHRAGSQLKNVWKSDKSWEPKFTNSKFKNLN